MSDDRKGWTGPLRDLGDGLRWMIPRGYREGMAVPGIVYADSNLLGTIREDDSLEQVANVACLPGIVGASLAMPDIHHGYGFPIGGVAATRIEDGVVAPGGIGYDINCGIRLLRSSLTAAEAASMASELTEALFRRIPSGVGSEGPIRLGKKEQRAVLEKGAAWAVEMGYGRPEDLLSCEEGGALDGADPAQVSEKALKRGASQLGTLGAGNHFVEISVVAEVYDREAAKAMGLEKGLVTLMIHSGSRGLGHQVCADFLGIMAKATRKHEIDLPDRQLSCAPIKSEEGARYLAAMASAANYAWANRQVLTHLAREALARAMGASTEELGLELVYDVAHNIAKIERHEVDGRRVTVCVHRKGATRAFGPGHPDIPKRYRDTGQPVLVPGDMGRCSYVLAGTKLAERETFGSTCHGAGRVLSRSAAKKAVKGRMLREELLERGTVVRASSPASLAEEAPQAYKDVSDVVSVVHRAGLASRVALLRPLGVIKG